MLVDAVRGLDFLSVVTPQKVGLDPALSHRSSPSGGADLRNVLRSIKIFETDRVIDIGCGKGDAIRTFLEFPFSRVDGVELASAVARIARRNFSKMARDVVVFETDATSFHAYGDYNIFYLYNPFPCEVVRKVVSMVSATRDRQKWRSLIIYNNPQCGDEVLESNGFFRLSQFSNRWDQPIVVYSDSPEFPSQ